jgi:hypothetical protein
MKKELSAEGWIEDRARDRANAVAHVEVQKNRPSYGRFEFRNKARTNLTVTLAVAQNRTVKL